MKNFLQTIFLLLVYTPFWLISQILKFLSFLLKPVLRLLKPVTQQLKNIRIKILTKRKDVYFTEDGIMLINCTRTKQEKFITFITIISTLSFFLMVLAAAITML